MVATTFCHSPQFRLQHSDRTCIFTSKPHPFSIAFLIFIPPIALACVVQSLVRWMVNGERWQVNWRGKRMGSSAAASASQSDATSRMEGWLYLIRFNRIGLQFSRKRYFVLDGNLLRSFKSVPLSNNQVLCCSFFFLIYFADSFFFFLNSSCVDSIANEGGEVSGLIVFALLDRVWHVKLFLWNFLRRILLEVRL